MSRYPMVHRRLGRCPDCGASVPVEILKGQPALIQLHGCPVRLCVYPGCSTKDPIDRMVGRASGEWYCPTHGLLLAARDLVALWRVEGDADWSAISELIETFPSLVAQVEGRERAGTPCSS